MKPSVYARNLAALHPTGPLPNADGPYSAFQQINGHHPWKYAVPNGFIEYQTRVLRRSKVLFFNFALAKEMGLIAKDHPHVMNRDLERSLVETFALRVINEYDQLSGVQFPGKDIKQNRYMATRYLQLQHDCRAGTTSGDGRSIWNGQYLHTSTGAAWDISSCGTGVTRLSPGFVQEGRPIKSGDKNVSYGSGLADVDEGLTAAILSESFHTRGINTERTLVVLDAEGHGINVRAARNLLRPSHLFLHLKQGNQLMLKSALDFYIARQVHNRLWPVVPRESEKYEHFLEQITLQYAQFASRLEDAYVFCWLDWDGDNMLMDGGIIDYGSIRQFGLCHHRYRYDDVDRFSTNLKEQKRKARYLVQTFVQLVDFVRTGQKKDLGAFSNSPYLELFDQVGRREELDLLLKRVGLSKGQRDRVLKKNLPLVEEFEKVYRFFERRESGRGMRRTPDGVNSPAIFCTRTLLRELPRSILISEQALPPGEFLALMATPFLTKKEMKREAVYAGAVRKFQDVYLSLLRASHKGKTLRRAVLETAMRASQHNQTGYATGDGIIYVIDELLAKRKKLGRGEFQKVMECLIQHQQGRPSRLKLRPESRRLLQTLLNLIHRCRFSI